MKILSTVLSFFLSAIILLNAHTIKSIPNPKHQNKHAYVSNPDGILSASTVNELNSLLDALEQENGAEVAVVAVKSIGESEIKPFATELFEKWGIGKADVDNGFLILFVEDQRKITFETGYGLEGILPDALCKRIQMNTMIPYFKEGDYSTGILAGTREVVSVIRGEDVASSEPSEMGVLAEDGSMPVPVYSGDYDRYDSQIISFDSFWIKYRNEIIINAMCIIALLIIAFVIILQMVWRTEKDTELSNVAKAKVIRQKKNQIFGFLLSASFFLGIFVIVFFIQIAGIFFLILSPFVLVLPNLYAKWRMKKIENTPVLCSDCQNQMHLLSNKDENKYLQSSQVLEEHIDSVLYDVYYCEHCKKDVVYKLNMPGKYTACPQCGNKTYGPGKSVTLRSASYTSTGLRRVTYNCKYCKCKNQVDEVIPRKQRSSSSGSSSSSSSSSSSGGGSFGGGSSGGGGSTSSW